MKFENVKISFADYESAQQLNMKKSPLLRLPLILAVILLITLCKSLAQEKFEFSTTSMIVLMVLILVLYMKLTQKSRLRKLFNSQKMVSDATFILDFSDEFYGVKSEHTDVEIPWDSYTKWDEDETVILLYQPNGSYNIIPKRIFSEEEMIKISELLIKGIAPK